MRPAKQGPHGRVGKAAAATSPVPTNRPRVIICTGMYSSGSTWLFNAVRGIGQVAYGAEAVASCYAETLDRLPPFDPGIRLLVVKCHMPTQAHLWLALASGGECLATIRDPRDAVASLMQRFGLTFDVALRMVAHSAALLAEAVLWIAEPLRFENGFPADPSTIPLLAARLGMPLSTQDAAQLHGALSPEVISGKIAALEASGIFGDMPAALAKEPETQWHPGHVGDGRIGKFREILDEAQATEVMLQGLSYIWVLGCAGWPSPAALPGPWFLVRPGEVGRHLPGAGFDFPNDRGVWTTGEQAVAWLPVGPPGDRGARICLDLSVIQSTNGSLNPTRWRLRVGEVLLAAGTAADGPQWRRLELDLPSALIGPSGVIRLDVTVEEVPTLAEMGVLASDRRLGLCLHAFRRIA